jgi:Flp pilus assembly protein TadB
LRSAVSASSGRAPTEFKILVVNLWRRLEEAAGEPMRRGKNDTSIAEHKSEQDMQSELQQLKTELAVQQATQAGTEATQAGHAATNAAAHAGTWSTFVVGGVALGVAMFLALALLGTARK